MQSEGVAWDKLGRGGRRGMRWEGIWGESGGENDGEETFG